MKFILGMRSETAEASLVLGELSENRVKIIDQNNWTAGRQLSDSLLVQIEDLLKRNKLSWSDLSGVVAYEGPGSFTGLRISITVANTMAYILNIPIASATGDDWFEAGVKKLSSGHFGDIVTPAYGAEANITKPRK